MTQSMDQVNAAVRRVRLGVINRRGRLARRLGARVRAVGVAGEAAGSARRRRATVRFRRLAVRAGDIRGPDEVERLAASFDQMAGQVQATVQAQREFAANASHQLRTPLTGMKLRLESTIAETGDEDVARS